MVLLVLLQTLGVLLGCVVVAGLLFAAAYLFGLFLGMLVESLGETTASAVKAFSMTVVGVGPALVIYVQMAPTWMMPQHVTVPATILALIASATFLVIAESTSKRVPKRASLSRQNLH